MLIRTPSAPPPPRRRHQHEPGPSKNPDVPPAAPRPKASRRTNALFGALIIAGLLPDAESAPLRPPAKDRRPFMVAELAERARERRAEAERVARTRGWRVRGRTAAGRFYELQAVRNGRPVYYITNNSNAAISTAVHEVREVSPYNLSGNGQTVGVWDGGAVRATHQEFGGRVTVMDGASGNFHATHVGGTIGAGGVVANARGMAPEVTIDSYDWNSDESEMASRGAALPGEAG